MALTVEDFLTRFVVEEKHEEATEALNELFAWLNFNMAKSFVKNYGSGAKNCSDSDSESEPKKKAVQKKKAEPQNNVEKKICCGTTSKGERCKNKAVEGDLCKVHFKKKETDEKKEKKENETKKKKAEPKKKKESKKKKEVPEHNHKLSEEEFDDCAVCQTHGNSVKETDENEVFEKVDLEKKLLESLNQDFEVEEGDEDPFGLNLNPDLELAENYEEVYESNSDEEDL